MAGMNPDTLKAFWEDMMNSLGTSPKMNNYNIPQTLNEIAEFERMCGNMAGVTPGMMANRMDPSFGLGSNQPKSLGNSNWHGYDALAMIGMRLRLKNGEKFPFEFMQAHVTDKSAFVFIVHDGKDYTLQDDVNLFPSDELITKLRLMIG